MARPDGGAEVNRGREGIVLAAVVLVLVALGLLAHGALLLAHQELRASLAGARVLQARLAAEAGYRAALSAASQGSLGKEPVGSWTVLAQGEVGGSPFRGAALRVSREVWQVEGRGRAAGAAWWAGWGGPAWILEPVGRLEVLSAVVEVAGEGDVVLGGDIDGFRLPHPRPLASDACGPWVEALDSLRPLEALPPVARVTPGPRGEPSLGPLGPEDLREALPALGWAQGRPRPATAGTACDTDDPLNLGAPSSERSPCSGHAPPRFVDGAVVMSGGVAQGILVATGDVVLDGTRYEGLILAGGVLTLRGGARLLGAARSGSGVSVDASSSVAGSICPILVALAAARDALRSAEPLWPPYPLDPPVP